MMPTSHTKSAALARHGSVLLIVLVSIVVLSLAAYTFSELALTDKEITQVQGDATQARRLAESGIEFSKYLAYLPKADVETMGGLFNNPGLFQGKLVLDDDLAQLRGRFTVISPDYVSQPGQTVIRYGLEDESARINLNALLLVDAVAVGAARDLLMALPGMTEEIADSILDWIDPDEDPREFGAESDYYQSLAVPYACPNRALTSVEELLLVRGVTPGLLYGIDGNRNSMEESTESSLAGSLGVTTQTESGAIANSGWAAYLTIHSAEKNVNPDGAAKVDLNNTDLEALADELGQIPDFNQDWVTYICALRLFGPMEAGTSGSSTTTSSSSSSSSSSSTTTTTQGQGTGTGTDTATQQGSVSLGDLDLTGSAAFTLSSVLDVIGSDVQVTIPATVEGEEDKEIILRCPFPNEPALMPQFLPIIMDWCACNVSPVIPGRISLNQAPEFLLQGLPGAPEGFAQAVADTRVPEGNADNDTFRHETWLLTEGIVTLDQMKTLLPFVCAGGAVYRGQFVGFFDGGGPAARIEAIIDGSGTSPKLLLWRNISHLGRGYSLSVLGSDATVAPAGLNQ